MGQYWKIILPHDREVFYTGSSLHLACIIYESGHSLGLALTVPVVEWIYQDCDPTEGDGDRAVMKTR
jgi:hypothetical protein